MELPVLGMQQDLTIHLADVCRQGNPVRPEPYQDLVQWRVQGWTYTENAVEREMSCGVGTTIKNNSKLGCRAAGLMHTVHRQVVCVFGRCS